VKAKKHTIHLTSTNTIDVILFISNRKLIKFSLNYRSYINQKWYEVYRVDNYHGFLHEHKFWRSNKKIPIKENVDNKEIIKKYREQIRKEYKKYRGYYKKEIQCK